MLSRLATYELKESPENYDRLSFNDTHKKAAAALTLLIEQQPFQIRPDIRVNKDNSMLLNTPQFLSVEQPTQTRRNLMDEQKKWLDAVNQHVNECFDFLEKEKKTSNNYSENSQNILKDLNLVMQGYQYIISLANNDTDYDPKQESKLHRELTDRIANEVHQGRDKNHTKFRLKLLTALLGVLTLAGIALVTIGALTMNPIFLIAGAAICALFLGSSLGLLAHQNTESFKNRVYENNNNMAHRLHKCTQTLFSPSKITSLTKPEFNSSRRFT